jgi:two-component system sensor histidine kinase CpxA
LRNALIHSKSTDRVSVRLRRSRSGIEIAIADRGTGVAENAIERIFEPFLRLDESRNHKQKGYGLGLAIAASVIKRHKGEISARNRTGGGLEVLIWLPAG